MSSDLFLTSPFLSCMHKGTAKGKNKAKLHFLENETWKGLFPKRLTDSKAFSDLSTYKHVKEIFQYELKENSSFAIWL